MPLHFEPAYPIRTERLLLRPWAEHDLDVVMDLYARADVVRYLLWDLLDRAEAEAFLERRRRHAVIDAESKRIFMAMTVPPDDRAIGDLMIAVADEEHRQGEIGWILHPDQQGHGYATEGAREMLRLGFDELGLHRISADADPRNGASLRVMERLGMRREAEFRESLYLKGEWAGAAIYAILEDEWRAR